MAKAFVSGIGWAEMQSKAVDIADNGSVDILPDGGNVLGKVTVNTNVPHYDDGYEDGKVEGYADAEAVTAALIERTITELKVPNGVKKIGSNFFAYASALQKVHLCEGLEEIDIYGFRNSGILEIELPQSVTRLAWGAFYDCNQLKTFKAGAALKTINGVAFYNNTECTLFDFSNTIQVPKLIAAEAFTGINANAKILVPAHLYEEWIVATNWGNFAQYIVSVYEAPDVTIPDRVSEGLEYTLGDSGTYYEVRGMGTCTDTVLVIPSEYNGLPVDGFAWGNSFRGNTDLVEVYIPESIGVFQYAFNECSNIEKLYIYCSSISSFEFEGMTSLKYVKFTKLTYISGGTFTGCENAVFDFSECSAVPDFDSCGYGSEFGTNPTIMVPVELYAQWVADTNWSIYADHIVPVK